VILNFFYNINMSKDFVVEIIGWLGITAILTGYLLVTFNLIISQSIQFQGLNLFGALGVIISSWAKKNYQIVVLNVIWFVAAGAGIYQILFK